MLEVTSLVEVRGRKVKESLTLGVGIKVIRGIFNSSTIVLRVGGKGVVHQDVLVDAKK